MSGFLRAGFAAWLMALWAAGTTAVARAASPDEPFVSMLRATCRITRDGHSGTAFLVRHGKDVYLVTAAHVFEEGTSPECRVVGRERKEGGKVVRLEAAVTVRREGQPLWRRHAAQDVAAIPFEPPRGMDVAPVPFERLLAASPSGESRVRLGDDAWLPGYPAQLEANAAGWPVLRRGMVAEHPLSPVADVPTFLADVRSFGGDSGAPLFVVHGGAAHVAGVVVGMQRQTDRTVSAVEEHTVHTPLGLAITVQADFVASVIRGFGK